MATVTPFQLEAWTEYGIGTLVLFLRYFARWKQVGFKQWQGDDFCALAALVFWTAELCMLELIGQNGTNIGVTDEMGALMTAAQIRAREFGSICLLLGWTFYITLIWLLKGCMLFFFNRMTLGLEQQKMVKLTALICAIGYVVVIAVVYGHCTPIQLKWQVYPNPGDKCTLDIENYLALAVVNVVTDVMIVGIPIPLLWKVKLPLRRKLAIGALLCSGVFIMVATILRCVLAIRDIEGINTSTIWSIRETFIGILAVNAPAIKPLFSNSKWVRGSSAKGTGGSSGMPYNSNSYPLKSVDKGERPSRVIKTQTSSEELIAGVGMGMATSPGAGVAAPSTATTARDIVVTTTYQIDVESSAAGHKKAPSGYWER